MCAQCMHLYCVDYCVEYPHHFSLQSWRPRSGTAAPTPLRSSPAAALPCPAELEAEIQHSSLSLNEEKNRLEQVGCCWLFRLGGSGRPVAGAGGKFKGAYRNVMLSA